MFSFFKNKVDPKAKLKKILKGYQLPSFPAVVMQILQKIRSPYSSASDVAQSLSLDPGLSVRLLGIANSAAFSPINKVENLTQAIALVGMSQLESLVLGVGVAKGIPKQMCQWHDPAAFWLTSARRAMLAHALAQILCPAKESECFTAAFLQDMALPFLACHRSEEYDSIFKKWHLEGGDLAQLEREVLEWDHAEVATWICSEWGLPENIALAIKNHHTATVEEDHETLGPVRLVSILREDDSNDGVDEMIARAEELYNISPDKMQSIIAPSFEQAKDLARMIV
ncbi:MAG: HDOD domain-containing protein [Proteobacteria bacterium]|nr:HDOD domain-containing protein [Pseudomonadota bacterium]MBU1585799.1 HDOD domain-containing protein [Pseudomonadota bacterium]MBU2452306.1 HDOD domain-containing protein [Pseudomonadota bacterium]MBU2630841.1 HDOD domain-containing protein [Pseudomonadota bacterium]